MPAAPWASGDGLSGPGRGRPRRRAARPGARRRCRQVGGTARTAPVSPAAGLLRQLADGSLTAALAVTATRRARRRRSRRRAGHRPGRGRLGHGQAARQHPRGRRRAARGRRCSSRPTGVPGAALPGRGERARRAPHAAGLARHDQAAVRHHARRRRGPAGRGRRGGRGGAVRWPGGGRGRARGRAARRWRSAAWT